MRSKAGFLVGLLIGAGLFGGVTASSVTAATSTKVMWKVSSLRAGQIKSLSAVATSNSPGVKTWSKTGSCTLYPTRKPTTLMMGLGADCTLTLQIARSGKYPAKKSEQTITRKLTAPTTTTTTVAPTTTTTTVAPTTTTTTVAPLVYNVGDTGPSGGIIFYKDLTRAAGSQYFEAACAGWSDGTCGGSDLTDPQVAWGCYGSRVFDADPVWGADGTAIGTGEPNTADIVRDCGETGSAAMLASDLSLGGKNDWFLPSLDELNEMNVQETVIGGLTRFAYWSSSEYGGAGSAWEQYFHLHSTSQNAFSKNNAYCVRPIRSF